MAWPDAELLLEGPRGRRLCWSLIDPGDYPGWDRVARGADAGDLTGLTDELTACVAHTDIESRVTRAGELALLAVLAEPVMAARYWQEPEDEDIALAAPGVRDALLPIARAVTAAPGARWWPTEIARDDQRYVEWVDEHDRAPDLTVTRARLASWRGDTIEDEGRERPQDPAAPESGYWWSAPILWWAAPGISPLTSTSRSIPGIGAVGLDLVEDPHDWSEARCWPIAARSGARICEISGPDDWTDLAGRYPLDVSSSRRHDWWRATGWTGTWLIPDFTAVAADYDAIHLSVAGYLATAGRALAVGSARTVLAGWNPDQTYWLADVLTLAGPATTWADPDREPRGWTQRG
jgi:hypothetical protein